MPNQNLNDDVLANLKSLYDKYQEAEEINTFYDYGAYLSYIFTISSAWFSEQKETFVLTLFFEEHENTHFFKKQLKECVEELKALPGLTKIGYISEPHTDKDSFIVLGKAIQAMTRCFFEVNKLHSTYNIGLAEVMVLGTKGGGKTTIVDYLLHGKFMPRTAPTLTPKVYNLIYDNFDFRVLDVCCEAHIKNVFDEHPIEPGKLPQAIVYVIDVSLVGEEKEKSVQEFDMWMDYLAKQYPENVFERIPILIFFNKTDLNPYFDEWEFEKTYKIKDRKLNLKYAFVSAKTGQGLQDNFSWLVKRIKVTEKY